MKLKQKTITISLIVACLLSLVFLPGAICRTPAVKPTPVELTIWGLWDDSDAFKEIIADYNAKNENIKVAYSKKEYQGYEDLILNSMAEGDGPDIFLINSKWIEEYRKKIIPMPQVDPLPQTVPFPTQRMGTADLQKDFVDVVSEDVILDDGGIYALPLSVDTLAMYYNKSVLNRADIPQPPETWIEFKEDIKKIKEIDEKGNIIKAGAAIGTARNINRSTDILSLLMLQTQTPMVDGNHVAATFNQMEQGSGENRFPGKNALEFYTDFASPANSFYTWNSKMDYAIDAFAQEKCAMIFGYEYLKDEIKKKQPYLNFAVAKMPQIKTDSMEINYANYWVYTVSRLASSPSAAWDFIKFMVSEKEAQKYLQATNKPTARRDLVISQSESDDPILEIFADQVLTAKSWFQKDSLMVENIFADMIDDVIYGRRSIDAAIKYGAERVTQTLN